MNNSTKTTAEETTEEGSWLDDVLMRIKSFKQKGKKRFEDHPSAIEDEETLEDIYARDCEKLLKDCSIAREALEKLSFIRVHKRRGELEAVRIDIKYDDALKAVYTAQHTAQQALSKMSTYKPQ